jgi:hypothetical protein
MWVLGVVGQERLEYWRLMLWSLMFRPGSFPVAVRLAILGYHFRRTCDLHVA